MEIQIKKGKVKGVYGKKEKKKRMASNSFQYTRKQPQLFALHF